MYIAYDTKLKRPGCAIIQAAFGATERIAGLFPPEDWLVDLTSDMKLYQITEGQLNKLVEYHRRKDGI